MKTEQFGSWPLHRMARTLAMSFRNTSKRHQALDRVEQTVGLTMELQKHCKADLEFLMGQRRLAGLRTFFTEPCSPNLRALMIGSSDYGTKQFEDSLHYLGRFFLVTAKSNRRISCSVLFPFQRLLLWQSRNDWGQGESGFRAQLSICLDWFASQ